MTGRIRLDEGSARMLYWLLAEERLRLLDERALAIASGTVATSYQQQTAKIRAVREEISRTAEEMHWDLGEPRFRIAP